MKVSRVRQSDFHLTCTETESFNQLNDLSDQRALSDLLIYFFNLHHQ